MARSDSHNPSNHCLARKSGHLGRANDNKVISQSLDRVASSVRNSSVLLAPPKACNPPYTVMKCGGELLLAASPHIERSQEGNYPQVRTSSRTGLVCLGYRSGEFAAHFVLQDKFPSGSCGTRRRSQAVAHPAWLCKSSRAAPPSAAACAYFMWVGEVCVTVSVENMRSTCRC